MDIETLNTFLTLAIRELYAHCRTAFCRAVHRDKPYSRTGKRVEYRTLHAQQPQRRADSGRGTVQDYAEKVITLTNASLSEISSLHKYANHLRIGCSDSIYEGHLAPIILEHQRQFPNDA